MEKTPIPAPVPAPPPRRPAPAHRSRSVIAIALLFLLYVCLSAYQGAIRLSSTHAHGDAAHHCPGHMAQKVPLEAHIISKCPDTRDALRKLILPVMQRVGDKVDFTLSYIGRPAPHDGIDCKHGPPECLGNILELCAHELYPDPKAYLGFVMCLTRDYEHIPDRSLVEDCALEHAVDFEAINQCATRDDGAHGIDLLRASVQRSAAANVSTSCTIRLNDEVYCVRDDGEWSDCPHGSGVNDLIIAIEKLYRA